MKNVLTKCSWILDIGQWIPLIRINLKLIQIFDVHCQHLRCITETALKRLMMSKGWQPLLPNIWNYSNKKGIGRMYFIMVLKLTLFCKKLFFIGFTQMDQILNKKIYICLSKNHAFALKGLIKVDNSNNGQEKDLCRPSSSYQCLFYTNERGNSMNL